MKAFSLALCLLICAPAIAGAQETASEKWMRLQDAVIQMKDSLVTAAHYHDGQKWQTNSYYVPSTTEGKAKFLRDLEVIEGLMSGEFADVKNLPHAVPGQILQHPESWLELAKARNEILKKIVGEESGEKAVAEVKFLQNIASKVRSSNGWGLTETGLKIFLGKREEVRLKLCGGQKYPGWDEACDSIIAAAKEMSTKARSYANYSDPNIDKLIRTGWAKNYKDRTILKVACAKKDWTVVKDSLGRPKYRSKGVAVQYKVPGCAYVIEQTISILEDYVGNGAYKYRPTSQLSDYRILSAK